MAEVKIYSTPTCPWCHKTKEFLKEHKIAFRDINVASDRKAAEEMVKISGQMGVPVIDIDGVVIVGYDVNAIRKALKMG